MNAPPSSSDPDFHRPPGHEATEAQLTAGLKRLASDGGKTGWHLGWRFRNAFFTGLVIVGPVTITLWIMWGVILIDADRRFRFRTRSIPIRIRRRKGPARRRGRRLDIDWRARRNLWPTSFCPRTDDVAPLVNRNVYGASPLRVTDGRPKPRVQKWSGSSSAERHLEPRISDERRRARLQDAKPGGESDLLTKQAPIERRRPDSSCRRGERRICRCRSRRVA